MATFEPYRNEEDSLSIGELTIENRLDQVALYGAVQITKDQSGLRQAQALKAVVDAVVDALEAEKALPEHISFKPTDRVDNPFQ